MIKYISVVVLFVQCTLNSLIGQTNKPGMPDPRDSIYQPVKNSLLSELIEKNNYLQYRYNTHNFLLNVALIPRGIMSIHYRYRFNDYFSVKGGAGYCFTLDKIVKFSDNYGKYSGGQLSDLQFSTFYVESNYKQGFNPYLSVSASVHTGDLGGGFYPSSYGYFEGDSEFSFEFGYRYYKQNFDTYLVSANSAGSGNFKINGTNLSINNSVFYAAANYSFETLGNFAIVQDIYFGVAYRFTNVDSYTAINKNNYPTPVIYESNGTKTNYTAPLIIIGYSVGFGLK